MCIDSHSLTRTYNSRLSITQKQVGVVGGRYHEFKARDRVLAIFPGSTVFYPATVMTAMPRVRAYMLRFEDDDTPKPRKIAGAVSLF